MFVRPLTGLGKSMQRYKVESFDKYDMEPDPHGIWVMADDATEAIAAAVAAERARYITIVVGERGGRGDSCCIGTCDAILDEIRTA